MKNILQTWVVLTGMVILGEQVAYSDCANVISKNEKIDQLLKRLNDANSGSGSFASSSNEERQSAIKDATSELISQFDDISVEMKKCGDEAKKSKEIAKKTFTDQFENNVVGDFKKNYEAALILKAMLSRSEVLMDKEPYSRSLMKLTYAMDKAKESTNAANDGVERAIAALPPKPIFTKEAFEIPAMRSTLAHYKTACSVGGDKGDFTVDGKCFIKSISLSQLVDELNSDLKSNLDHIEKRATSYGRSLDRYCEIAGVNNDDFSRSTNFGDQFVMKLSTVDSVRQVALLETDFKNSTKAEDEAYAALERIRSKLKKVIESEDLLIEASNRSQVSSVTLKRQYSETLHRLERAQGNYAAKLSPSGIKDLPFPRTKESVDSFLKRLNECNVARTAKLDPNAVVEKSKKVMEVDERHTGNHSVGRKDDRSPATTSPSTTGTEEPATSIGADGNRAVDSPNDHSP